MKNDMHTGASELPEEQADAHSLDAQARRVIQALELPHGASARLAAEHDDPVIASPNPLHGVKATLKVCVGHAEVSVGQLLGTKIHDVLPLDREIDDPVDVLLNGVVIGRGTLVAVDGQFGIRLTELPCPLRV